MRNTITDRFWEFRFISVSKLFSTSLALQEISKLEAKGMVSLKVYAHPASLVFPQVTIPLLLDPRISMLSTVLFVLCTVLPSDPMIFSMLT